MIDALQTLLADRCYLAKGARCPANISFRRPNFVELFPDSKRSIVVKAVSAQTGAAEALAREYETLRYHTGPHGSLIPAPIAFEIRDGHAFLVMEGVAHGPTTLSDLTRPLPSSAALGQFLGAPDTPSAAGAYMPAALSFATAAKSLPEDIRAATSALAARRDWHRWESTLPATPQHSDLAINNVGRKASGFVLFDWEDYGRVTFPGFDLAVLLVSACEFDRRRLDAAIKSLTQQETGSRGVLAHAVALLPTERARLREIVVISLVLFHALKCTLNYDGDVIGRCRALLTSLMDV